MKRIKKFVTKLSATLAAAAILAVTPGANVMEVEAAPNTYYLKYDIDDHVWRMQINEWKDGDEGRELYYLNEGSEKVKDGDIVVVLDNENHDAGSENIQINARVGNLTINRAHAIVTVHGGIDECHVLGESYAAITGNVTNGYVYDDATCTFHSNVTNLKLTCTENFNAPETTVTVGGTVAYAATANTGGILKEYYNFKAGTFHYDGDSGMMTDVSNYSTNGSGPAASTPPAPSNSGSSSSGSNSSSGAYDDVPKTGESNIVVWLFAAAAVCAMGSVMLKRRVNN